MLESEQQQTKKQSNQIAKLMNDVNEKGIQIGILNDSIAKKDIEFDQKNKELQSLDDQLKETNVAV